MITVSPIHIEGTMFTSLQVELPKTNLLIISNEIGYIMCAALDVDVMNERLKDRKVIAARASGVRSIQQLLYAPLEKVTVAAREAYGWRPGMTGKEALTKII